MELRLAVFILTLPFLSNFAQSIRFQLESGRTKCIYEDIKKNAMTVGKYSIVNPNPNEGLPLPEHHKLTAMLYTSAGNRLHYAEAVESGEFWYHVDEGGNFMACFTAAGHEPAVNVSIEFNWKSGLAAKDWSNVVKKGSIDAMLLELKKMEDTIAIVRDEMYYLRERLIHNCFSRRLETLFLNRDTKSKMGYLSLVSLFLCLSVAVLQLWHLKSFFEKKKII